jgi:hypothetical protein
VLGVDGTAFDGATVSLGGSTLQTDSAGNALFENLSSGALTAQVRASGFAPVTVVTELESGANGLAVATLLPFEPPVTFSADTGGTIKSKGVQVAIPAGALRDENGQPVTGEAQLYVAPLDPSTEAISAAPGPFVGITANGGGNVEIESFFMAEISLAQDERQLQLAPGAVATIRFNLPPALAATVKPGDSIPAWWFDLAAGVWREEGMGVVEESPEEPGKLVWAAQVSHFTWWNADKPISTHSCVNVLVRDANGQPRKNQLILLNGVDYSYSTENRTNSTGSACLVAKLGGKARVRVHGVRNPQSAVDVTPTSNARCESQSCQQVVLTVESSCGAAGTRQRCSYSGPAGTENVGVCKAAYRVCDGVAWGPCAGQRVPSGEVCDGKDNNCDGRTDEGSPGSGAACNTRQPGVCSLGTSICQGGTLVCTPSTSPSNEVCDGKDNNCNGQTDEGNPEGGAACSTGQPGVCAQGSSTCSGGTLVCNRNVAPSSEVCDGKDNNCDGQTDEGNPGGSAACNTGEPGVCAQGSTTCSGGTLACTRSVAPSSEVCDGQDNNCDGQPDEGNPGGGVACNTGEPGVCAQGSTTCSGGTLACTRSVAPSSEVCDGQDNNCDGQPDEGNPGGGAACNTGELGVCAQGSTTCSGGTLACTRSVAPSSEVCDGQDNNCNGQADEGNPGGGAACNTGQPGVCAQGSMACSGGTLSCRSKIQASNEVCDGLDNDCNGKTDETCPAGVNYFGLSAKETDSARHPQNSTNRTVVLAPGQTLEVGTCTIAHTKASGDTYLRLYAPNGGEVAENDEGQNCINGASFLTYTVPANGQGGTYVIRAGCYQDDACSGTVGYRIF